MRLHKLLAIKCFIKGDHDWLHYVSNTTARMDICPGGWCGRCGHEANLNESLDLFVVAKKAELLKK